MTNSGAWFWMKLLHLQQIPVVAHTTHNRLRPDLTQPPSTIPHHTTHHPIHIPTKTFHPSIPYHLHTHPYTDAYTLTRSIVNKLLTLYIYIDILTFI